MLDHNETSQEELWATNCEWEKKWIINMPWIHPQQKEKVGSPCGKDLKGEPAKEGDFAEQLNEYFTLQCFHLWRRIVRFVNRHPEAIVFRQCCWRSIPGPNQLEMESHIGLTCVYKGAGEKTSCSPIPQTESPQPKHFCTSSELEVSCEGIKCMRW